MLGCDEGEKFVESVAEGWRVAKSIKIPALKAFTTRSIFDLYSQCPV